MLFCDHNSETSCLFSFQDLYRILLEAESEGILTGVDMAEVEKFILDPE